MKDEGGGGRKCRKSQGKEEEGATDDVCLSMLSRTAALNWVLAGADLLSELTKEGSQQRLPGGAESFGGCGESELTWMREEEEEGETAAQRRQRCFNKRGLRD